MPNFCADTHPGRVEESNEDSIGWNVDRRVWLVADGMGGHAKGEVASRLVKETILEEIGRAVPLRQSVLDAHRVVAEQAQQAEDRAAMGSTVVAIEINGSSCDVVWVGDSRAYLWRGRALRRLSKDHSLLELLLSRNVVSEAEARDHPQRHLVTQSLGMGDPTPDEEHLELRKRDWLLLSSDGLTDELSDDEIADHLRRSASLKEAVDALMTAALDKGARDNVSVVIVESDEGAWMPRIALPQIEWRPIVFGALGAFGAFVLFLLLEWLQLG
jgi:PPM family protein phosphatase